jgi:hypothetical protein
MHKENNTKIKNIEEYKNHLLLSVLNSARQKNLAHDPTHVSHNFCLVTNMNIYKYRVN